MRGIVQEEKHWEFMLKLTNGVEKLRNGQEKTCQGCEKSCRSQTWTEQSVRRQIAEAREISDKGHGNH
jgi:hypothetical protein